MGKTGKCGSCSDCSCDEAPAQPSVAPPPYRPAPSRYLKQPSKKGPQPDPTPLEARCPHYEVGAAARWQCYQCIVSWVLAVEREQAERVAKELEGKHRQVAAERIRRAIEEYLGKAQA